MARDPRRRVPIAASEQEMLDAFLEYCQDTILIKIDGVNDADLRRAMVPSGTSLLGIVKHLAYVHRWWFRIVFEGEELEVPWTDDDPDADWRIEPHETTAAIVDLYRDEVAHSRAISARAALDDVAQHPESQHTLRWLLPYMIQEISRHNGHADILREMIDGVTGR